MASTRRRSTKITKHKKKTIQDLFKSEMGLLVDEVKPNGSGRPNDRNTGKRFSFLEIIENLLEIMASTKILFAGFI